MNTSSILLFSEYEPTIEITTMNGVKIAHGTRMIIASRGTAGRQDERQEMPEVDARDGPIRIGMLNEQDRAGLEAPDEEAGHDHG